ETETLCGGSGFQGRSLIVRQVNFHRRHIILPFYIKAYMPILLRFSTLGVVLTGCQSVDVVCLMNAGGKKLSYFQTNNSVGGGDCMLDCNAGPNDVEV